MHPTRFSWIAAAILVLIFSWASTAVRGDQSPDNPKLHLGGALDSDRPAEDLRMSSMGRVAQLAATGRLDKALAQARGGTRGLEAASPSIRSSMRVRACRSTTSAS